MNVIGNRQKAILHVARAKLGLTEEVYRDILMIHGGVKTSRDLDWPNYRRVMRHLGTLGFRPGARGKGGSRTAPTEVDGVHYAHVSERPGFASARQLRMIEGMWADLSFAPPNLRKAALREFLRKRFGVHDLRFLTGVGAGKVINALLAMKNQRPEVRGQRTEKTEDRTDVL